MLIFPETINSGNTTREKHKSGAYEEATLNLF